MVQFDRSMSDLDKVVSTLSSIEARSAIRRLEKAGRLTAFDAASALDALRSKLQQMTEQSSSAAVLQTAARLVDRHNLRALDSLQLGSAIVARDLLATPDMQFIASDKTLLEAARLEGFKTWNPCD